MTSDLHLSAIHTRRHRVPHAFAICLLIAGARAQSPLPPAPERHVLTISGTEYRGSEPSIAVNPNNPRQIVVAFQPATVAYSVDGGESFTRAELPRIPNWGEGGDVSVTFDSHGNAYLGTLHFDKLGSTSYWAHGGGRNGIFVRHSTDGGKTWDKSAVAVKAFNGEEPEIQWQDMPRLFSDTQPHSPYRGNVYIGWIEWQLDKSIILFARSTDQGKTFSAPIRISTHAGLPRDDNGALVGFVGVVGADGTIYAIWNDGSGIALTTSHDGGNTFFPSRTVFEVAPPYFGGAGGIPGVSRAMGFPQIGVDSSGKGPASLYISWSDYRDGDVDVFCASSQDHGRHWSKPVRVNSDPVHDGIDQFFQWMAVDPVTGDVYVQFYDRRDDPANRKTGVTLARSTDGGKAFANYAWSSEPFASDRPAFLGDYTWLAAYDGKVYGAWTETVPTEESSGRPATAIKVGIASFHAQEPH